MPYDQWPNDSYQRQYQAEDALGQALAANLNGQLQFIRKNCMAIAPTLTEAEAELLAREDAFSGVYALLMVLDGVAGTGIDANHGIAWALQARILKYGNQSNSVEVSMETGNSVTLSSFAPPGRSAWKQLNLPRTATASVTLFTNGRKPMTITINLEPEKEARLRQKAARTGLPAEQLVQDFVTQGLDKSDAEEHEAASGVEEPTLAELFAGRTGLVNSEGRFNYSSHTGKAYTESLLKQKEQKANAKEG